MKLKFIAVAWGDSRPRLSGRAQLDCCVGIQLRCRLRYHRIPNGPGAIYN